MRRASELIHLPKRAMEEGGSRRLARAGGGSPERLEVLRESHPAALRSATLMRKRWSTATAAPGLLPHGPITTDDPLRVDGDVRVPLLGRR